MKKKPKVKLNVDGLFDWMFGPPQQPRLSKKQRREQRRREAETKHRVEFLDYLRWVLTQPAKRSKY